jgi:acyl carrier protein
MTRKEFLNLLAEIVEEDPGTLTGNELLKEQVAGWNSLAVVSFIALVDEHFDFPLSPKAIVACSTVNDLIALLDGRIHD